MIRISKALAGFNRIPKFWLIFTLLCINHIMPVMDGNEEMYFALARQFVDPDWIPNSFLLTESAGTRLIFQYIVGYILLYVPFEIVSIGGQLLVYGFMAFGLSKILESYKLSNVLVLLLFQVLFLRSQSFFGGEWIFQAFETKSVSYVFIIFSIYHALQCEWKKSVIWTIPAIYFHILVGGWYAVSLFLLLLMSRVKFLNITKLGILLTLAVVPILFYLISSILVGTEESINGVNLDWIYTYYRNPHHTVSFYMGWDWFRIHRFDGFLLLIVAVVLTLLIYKREGFSKSYKTLLKYCFTTYIILVVAILVSAIDTNGKFLKFYFYRIGSMSLLFTLIALLVFANEWLRTRSYKNIVFTSIFIISIINLGIRLDKKTSTDYSYDRQAYMESVNFMESNIDPGSSMLLLNTVEHLDFIRQTRLDLFISQKFVPSGGNKLYHWYMRMEDAKALQSDHSNWERFNSDYQIEYVLSGKELDLQGLSVIHKNEGYFVYKNNQRVD